MKQLDIEQEIKDRLAYFYKQTDGTMNFPNSAEGDILKLVHRFFNEQDAKQINNKII